MKNFKRVVLLFIYTIALSSLTGNDDSFSSWQGDPVHLDIFSLARGASSSHNSQPWKIVSLSKEKYAIFSVKERQLLQVDPNGREQLISLGALIENLHTAAECYGYSCTLSLNLTSEKIGEFTLTREDGIMDRKTINIMKSSHTEKGKLLNKLPEELDMADLFREIDALGNAFWYSRDSSTYNYIKKESPRASAQQADSNEAQRELAEYITYSIEDEQQGIGMTPVMLDLPGFMSRSWNGKANVEKVMSGFFRSGASSKVKTQINNCAGVIILTSPDNSSQSLIDCGRLYQRLVITARENHLEIQPLSQMLEEEPWKGEINKTINIKNPIQMILRAGIKKGTPPDYNIDAVSSASIRMPLSNFIEIN